MNLAHWQSNLDNAEDLINKISAECAYIRLLYDNKPTLELAELIILYEDTLENLEGLRGEIAALLHVMSLIK